MKILVACEESQAVTKELRARGHEAYSCDIIECSGGHPEWHIMQDVLPLLNGKCYFKTSDGTIHNTVDRWRWDMIIAFPPCTYLSNAGACRLYPRKGIIDQSRYKKGLKAKEFFMMFYNADCARIAIENPVSSKIFEMPPHSQEIHPYQFYGKLHPYTKKTRLWIKGLPELIPIEPTEPISPYVPAGTGRKDRSKYGAAKRGEDAKNRAKTFPGIAKAMAEQWAGQAEEKEKAHVRQREQ